MALNLAELIIISLIVDWLFRRYKIPGLVGMLLVGVVLGPYALNLMSPNLINISNDLRMISLLVILLRAGFELSKDTLFKVGKYALLLSFVPAVFEGLAVTFLGHLFLDLSYLESAMLGAILSAVSPAVVVPLMLKFIDEKKGSEKGIPTLVLAASSIDDVFVIVVYSVLSGLYFGSKLNIAMKLIGIPVSIILGIAVGWVTGLIIYKLFEKFNPRATKRLLVILGIAVFLSNFEHLVKDYIEFASLISVMTVGFVILEKNKYMAHEISAKLSKLWIFAEILLFTLVGAQVNLKVALNEGLNGSIVILLGLVARSIGSYICLHGSNLDFKEKMFVVVSYIPKATVQAAIGASPLIAMKSAGMNTAPGEIILAVAVLSILMTAPVGAWAISMMGNKILKVPENLSKADKMSRKKVLETFNVEDVMIIDIPVAKENDKVSDIISIFSDYDIDLIPVVDKDNNYLGYIMLNNLRAILNQKNIWDLVLAYDVMVRDKETLNPKDSLKKAFALVGKIGKEIPVIEDKKLIGLFDSDKANHKLESRLLQLKLANTI